MVADGAAFSRCSLQRRRKYDLTKGFVVSFSLI
jgi:hypothetical protein